MRSGGAATHTSRTIGPAGSVGNPGPGGPTMSAGDHRHVANPHPGSDGPAFFFDFIDPGSWLATSMIDQAGATDAVRWHGFELRPPPRALIDPCKPDWKDYHSAIGRCVGDLGVTVSTPDLVPWTRKAHELCAFARERDCYHTVRRALFEAHFVDRTDIGRIDLLVEIAHGAGLDRSETQAVLDVDRYTEVVRAHRATARAAKIAGVPALVSGSRRMEGLASPDEASRWTRCIMFELTAATER